MSSSRNAYHHAGCKDAVWNKASTVRGYNPDTHRKDPAGNIIYYGSHGKDSQMGWNIDHIKPQAKGGSDALRNLQALQSTANKSYGAKTGKPNRHM
jgi:5-methylcytosine-specific restriction endonuclease McrA